MSSQTSHLKLVEDEAVDNLGDNTVQRPAPSAEHKPFEVVERRYDTGTATPYLENAKSFIDGRTATDPQWMQDLRQEALSYVAGHGIPTPRLERWKYTNLQSMAKLNIEHANDQADLEGIALPEKLSPLRAVFVNGVFAKELSDLPEGIEICGCISENMDTFEGLITNAPLETFNDQMLWALNSVYTQSGFGLRVPKNMVMDQPIEALSVWTKPLRAYPRMIVQIERNAQAHVIEHVVHMNAENATAEQALNLITAARIDVGQNASLTHFKVQDYTDHDWILQNDHITQDRDSRYTRYTLNASAEKQSREQIWVQIQGENAECTLNGVQLSDQSNALETLIHVDHEAPNCESNQDYRHVASGQSSCTFQGKVHVHQIAQLTNAYQMSRGVTLSERAEVNTKPELEIYADDVKCSHGATTGQIDEQALFYMRARGLNEQEARRMLLTSFVSEVFEDIDEDSPVMTAYKRKIAAYLEEVVA